MHQADRGIAGPSRRQCARLLECTHIVDQCSARLQRRRNDTGLAGVDRHGNRQLPGERGNDRRNPIDLFLLAHRLRPWSRRLAADIDHAGTRLRHGDAMLDGPRYIDESTAVGKRIRRDIQNAHHDWRRQVEAVMTTVEEHGWRRLQRAGDRQQPDGDLVTLDRTIKRPAHSRPYRSSKSDQSRQRPSDCSLLPVSLFTAWLLSADSPACRSVLPAYRARAPCCHPSAGSPHRPSPAAARARDLP